MKKPELLAPAGDLEKMQFALSYGADAVYLSGKQWGLRTFAGNFTLEELSQAVTYTHALGKKVYVTLNIFAHNKDLEGIPAYLQQLAALNVDGLIISDPGLFMQAREHAPKIPIHISTQANTTNWAAVEFWERAGASRIVLARELSLQEIITIQDKEAIELEVFVHGAMCMAYSGRCLLSNFLTGRGANQGSCAHPCRYLYHVVEEKRPDQPITIEEDERGAYLYNAKDLCMIHHLPALMEAGVDSLKIEGRMKSVYYTATVVKAYRQAIDAYAAQTYNHVLADKLFTEVSKVSHREYSTGFYFQSPTAEDHNYETSAYKHTHDFIGVVRGYDKSHQRLIIEQRNHFASGDVIEFCPPTGEPIKKQLHQLFDQDGQPIDKAPHPQQTVQIPHEKAFPPFTLLRRERVGI